ncbi:MAG: Bax inhibitor-1/YccA family protein [Chloroflexota bacterium]
MINEPNPPNQYGQPQPAGAPAAAPNTVAGGVRVGAAAVPREGFLTASFVWMFIGLLLSAGSAWFVMSNPATMAQVIDNWFILLIGQLALVFGLSFLITRLPSIVALGAFFVYALLMGLTLGVIVAAYTAEVDPVTGQLVFTNVAGVVTAFLGASAIFAGAALYGAVTKRDLTSLQGILFMGLLGLLVVMLVQVFFFPGSGWLNLAIGVVGVVIFTGLTAWDVQRIRNGQVAGINSESASVMGALALYLDFVNLFLFLLRIFGNSR